ncbi:MULTISPECIES: helix-turn-helix domain-containing protein [Halorussus]|uniref:helix-turn-helix domain-containing protein n=1 Tax=Halorussus TaxID=1070314 RepID=UPI000E210A4B|nr:MULTISPECIES: helix-turn-helix domain-containing protein [Halorussus]NHN61601.1 DNA-binding protein [Halorussus sp. JP-T4]
MPGETVYAELKIREPNRCQVAATSESDARVSRVSRTVIPNENGRITEELEVERSPDDEVSAAPVDRENGVFRLRRPVGQGCPCELVERQECPVRTIHADDGELFLTFYAEEIGLVRRAVADLKECCEGVHLQRLYEADEGASRDLVYVDRDRFTDRQLEALRTAHEMGYFSYPKEANAGEVADALGIASTTFTEHLSNAQSKLLEHLLGE